MEALLQDMINDFKADLKSVMRKNYSVFTGTEISFQMSTLRMETCRVNNPDVQFWVYTRVATAADMRKGY
jgi:hypothetical protein